MATELTLLNNGNNKKFLFRAVSAFRNKKSQPVISIPLINTDSDDQILFRFFGQSEEVSFTFAIFNDGTDVSGGTYLGVPTTVDDQITYLRDIVFSHEFDTNWTITQSRYYSGGVDGVITDLQFDNRSGGTTLVTGSFTFKRGNIGNL